jgi:hypothetical protein
MQPSFDARHYHGSMETRRGTGSCSASSAGGRHVAASPTDVDEVIDDEAVLGNLLGLLD